jgi:hypothetical protein
MKNAGETEKIVERTEPLHAELAGVALRIAELLTRPRHDEAVLAELDSRARELRRRIAAEKEPQRKARADGFYRYVSGG